MTILLAVDPGINGCGIAQFVNGVLEEACYVTNFATKADSNYQRAGQMAQRIWHEHVRPLSPPTILAVEHPQIYRAGRGGENPANLLPLAAVGGALAALALRAGTQDIRAILPAVWKGQAPDRVVVARVDDKLTEREKDFIEVCSKSYMHNVTDAIGIGLYTLGRW